MNAAVVFASAFVLTAAMPAFAQDYPPPPSFSSGQVDNLVSRIALYPDPLLAQIFAAASFPDQIPDAARWADQNRNLRGNELADTIYQANLQFDPAVQALLPFPPVLDMMASDLNWTSSLGNAVLADRSLIMDSVQRMRRSAEQYGYLQSNQQIRVVNNGPAVEIEPVDPALIYVPAYDPYVVYAPPRPGFFVGGAIGFGSYYSIGAFGGWGWGGGFNWHNHAVLVNNSVWGRTWYNRDAYVHNYGNWDRGAWRNTYNARNVTINNDRTYYRNDNVNRYSNTYSNSRNYNRGSQYSNTYSNQGGYNRNVPSAPAAPSRGYDRGNNSQYSNGYSNPSGYNRSVPSAPAAPSRGYERGNNSQYSNGYSNQGGYNRSVPSAPAAPSRGYERNTYSNPGRAYTASPAPAAQGRSFGAVSGNQGAGNTSGHFDRAGGRRY